MISPTNPPLSLDQESPANKPHLPPELGHPTPLYPSLAPLTPLCATRPPVGAQAPVVNRLYASAEAQAALLKSREEARAAKELEACTFRPEMSSGTSRR